MGIKWIRERGPEVFKGLFKQDLNLAVQALKPELSRLANEWGQEVVQKYSDEKDFRGSIVRGMNRHPIARKFCGLIIGGLRFPEFVEPLVNSGWGGMQEGLSRHGKVKESKKQLSEMEAVVKKAIREQVEEARIISEVKTSVDDEELVAGYCGEGEDRRIEVHYKHCPRGLRQVFAKKSGLHVAAIVTPEEADADGYPMGNCCEAIKRDLDKLKQAANANTVTGGGSGLSREEMAQMIDEALNSLKDDLQIQDANLWTKLSLTEEQWEALKKSGRGLRDLCEQHVIPALSGAAEATAKELEVQALAPVRKWGKTQRAKAKKSCRARKRRRQRGESLSPPVPTLGQDIGRCLRAVFGFFFGGSSRAAERR